MGCWIGATLPRWIGIAADQPSGKVFSQRGRRAVKLPQRSSSKDGEHRNVRERDDDGLFRRFQARVRERLRVRDRWQDGDVLALRQYDFDEREGKVNTTGLTLLDLDWANRSALVLVCKRCGHLERFLG